MAKDAYYFSHDSNSKDDPKCVMLIEQLGLEGYGIFWVLIETLRDQPEYKYPLALIPAIARRFNTTGEKVKTVVMGYGLFEVDEKDFFSLSLIDRMKVIEAKREQARQAINKRWGNQKALPEPQKNDTEVIRAYNASNTDVIQGKERKGKESKVKESKILKNTYAEYVKMTEIEYQKLIDAHGETETKRMVDILDNYKGSTGKTYKDDYRAILSWVVERAKTERIKVKPLEPQKTKRDLENEAFEAQMKELREGKWGI